MVSDQSLATVASYTLQSEYSGGVEELRVIYFPILKSLKEPEVKHNEGFPIAPRIIVAFY